MQHVRLGHQGIGSGTCSAEARTPQLVSGQALVYTSPDPATLLYGRQYDGRCKKLKTFVIIELNS